MSTPRTSSVSVPAKRPTRNMGVTMLDKYRQHLIEIRRSPNTIRLRLVYARQLLEAHPSIAKIRPAHLESFVYSNPSWKPETINACISSCRSFLGWAHRNGYIASDPSQELRPIKVPQTPKRVVPDAVLLKALAGASLRDRALLMLGGEDGLRRSEIATLHTRHRSGNVLTVTGKGGKTRVLGMSPELCEVLDALAAGKATYYFPGRFGGHAHPSTIYEASKRLLRFNTHAMRHRAISTVYRSGGKDVFLTQKFAGHSSSNTTMGYVHFDADDMVIAVEASRFTNSLDLDLPMAA